jgi:hypothetical protein
MSNNNKAPIAPHHFALSIDPRTGRPFVSVMHQAAYEHGARHRAAIALADHHLTKLKAQRR